MTEDSPNTYTKVYTQDHINDIPVSEKISNAVYSDKDIIKEYNNGNLIIYPFNRNQVGNCSYDVTLGEFYFSPSNKCSYLNPWNAKSITNFWGSVKKATYCMADDDEMGVKKGKQYIVLQPHEVILAHTQEFIGVVKGATTMMKGRSTMGRCGVSICKDAGWGDVGYFNRWVVEIENHNKIPVVMIVGQKIGQIVFISCGEINNSYYQSGSYQKGSTLEEVKANWKPEDMLPIAKLFTDTK